jgi:hypothetical protein
MRWHRMKMCDYVYPSCQYRSEVDFFGHCVVFKTESRTLWHKYTVMWIFKKLSTTHRVEFNMMNMWSNEFHEWSSDLLPSRATVLLSWRSDFTLLVNPDRRVWAEYYLWTRPLYLTLRVWYHTLAACYLTKWALSGNVTTHCAMHTSKRCASCSSQLSGSGCYDFKQHWTTRDFYKGETS